MRTSSNLATAPEVSFLAAGTEHIPIIAELARQIWPVVYDGILTAQQPLETFTPHVPLVGRAMIHGSTITVLGTVALIIPYFLTGFPAAAASLLVAVMLFGAAGMIWRCASAG